MYPHFVCPNCRAVADLEAELDEPVANGEWEQVPEEIANEGSEATPSPVVAPPATSEQAAPAVPAVADLQVQESSRQDSDIELPDASDSEARPLGPDGRYEEGRDTPSPVSDSPPPEVETSSATVPPVDIAPRRSTSSVQREGLSSHAQRAISHRDRSATRTPSPNGQPGSLSDAILAGEGPMTPRNDIGPFVFDGSAGRLVSAIGALPPLSPTGTQTPDETPTPTSVPSAAQPQVQAS
jgi:hypothetical protein